MMKKAALFAALTMSLALSPLSAAVQLSPKEMQQVARMVWQNECAGTVEGLVAWNKGEAFPSLGIGHFIWYPKGTSGPFDESFPRLMALMEQRGIAIPGWAKGAAPWSTAEAMHRDSKRVSALRQLLSQPKSLEVQTEFLIQRLDAALPKMLKAAPANRRDAVRRNFEILLKSSRGSFAMIDYVNFKGEGILETERYSGHGWGLLQVLEGMQPGAADPVKEFGASAARVLERRVKNAPAARGEQRWMPGWRNRVMRY